MNQDWQIGDLIQGRWKIEKMFKGGMGVVYVVYEEESSDVFAAKTFQGELLTRSPRGVARFTQEALSWIGLDIHPNITRAHRVETIEGRPMLFLEYVTGGDLAGWIGSPRLTADPAQIWQFALHFCDGMHHALSKGIKAHRDVKPANCLITSDGVLKVTDFGLAKAWEEDGDLSAGDGDAMERRDQAATGLSRTGEAAGTITHMAPEQFEDAKHVDVRADIYSFGIMLFQMITGRLPFSGRNWVEMERLHRTEPPPALPTTDSEVRRLVETCLAKDPSERFRNFREIRTVLEGLYAKASGKPAPAAIAGIGLEAFEWSNKGSSLAHLGRMESALRCYEHALELDSRHVTALIGKGAVMESLGRWDDAMECCGRALAIHPRHPVAWSNQGNLHSTRGDYEKAVSCFDQAIGIKPLYATAWLNKGAVLFKAGRNGEAMTCLDRALELQPRDADAWSNKGYLWISLGRNEDARGCFDRAVEIQPRHGKAWHGLGILLGAMKKMAEALPCFEKAVESNPRDREAWFYLGRTLAFLDRVKAALACLEEAGRLGHPEAAEYIALCRKSLTDPDDVRDCGSMETVQEIHQKGLALGRQNRFDEAIACCDRALKMDPNHADSWAHKCLALLMLSRVDDALVCVREARRLDHPKAAALFAECYKLQEIEETYAKGLALHQKGRIEEEITCYDRVLQLHPEHAKAWHNKGVALLMLLRSKEALVCLEKARELGHPQSAKAIELCHQHLDKGAATVVDAKGATTLPATAVAGNVDRQTVLQRVLEATTEEFSKFELEKAGVRLHGGTHFARDIGCDKLDIAELMFRIEHNFGIYLKDPERWDPIETVSDAVDFVIRHAPSASLAGVQTPISAVNRDVAGDFFYKASADRQAGRFQEALLNFSAALKLDPMHPQAWYNKALTLENMGLIAEAATAYDEARRLGHSSAADRIAWCRKLLADSPRDPVAAKAYFQGESLADAQRFQEALAFFDQAIRIQADHAPSWYKKGWALRNLPDRGQEALACYDRAIELNPRYTDVWNSKGCLLLYVLGKVEEAVPCFQRAMELDPTSFYAFYNMGWLSLYRRRNPTEALTYFDRAIQCHPTYPDAWLEKGSALGGLGRHDEELACYNRLLEFSPNHAAAWVYKGYVVGKLGRTGQDIPCYDRAIELDPRNELAWENKGIALRLLEKTEEAIACYDRALEINPRKPLLWYRKGWALKNKLARHEEALACYNRTLDLDPRYEDAWIEKGHLMSLLKRPEEELVCYDHVIGLNPQNAPAWFFKGWALQDAGRLHDAISAYERAQHLGHAEAAGKIEECRRRL